MKNRTAESLRFRRSVYLQTDFFQIISLLICSDVGSTAARRPSGSIRNVRNPEFMLNFRRNCIAASVSVTCSSVPPIPSICAISFISASLRSRLTETKFMSAFRASAFLYVCEAAMRDAASAADQNDRITHWPWRVERFIASSAPCTFVRGICFPISRAALRFENDDEVIRAIAMAAMINENFFISFY